MGDDDSECRRIAVIFGNVWRENISLVFIRMPVDVGASGIDHLQTPRFSVSFGMGGLAFSGNEVDDREGALPHTQAELGSGT